MLIVALIIILIVLILLDNNISCFSTNKTSSFQDITLDDLNTIALSDMPETLHYNSTNPAINQCYKDSTNDYINSDNELVAVADNSNKINELENVINSMYNIQHTESSGFSNKMSVEHVSKNKKTASNSKRLQQTNDTNYTNL